MRAIIIVLACILVPSLAWGQEDQYLDILSKHDVHGSIEDIIPDPANILINVLNDLRLVTDDTSKIKGVPGRYNVSVGVLQDSEVFQIRQRMTGLDTAFYCGGGSLEMLNMSFGGEGSARITAVLKEAGWLVKIEYWIRIVNHESSGGWLPAAWRKELQWGKAASARTFIRTGKGRVTIRKEFEKMMKTLQRTCLELSK